MRYVFAFGVFAVLGVGGQAVFAQTDCEAARCTVQAALDMQCPCDLGVPGGTVAATNHGHHVSCVARVVNGLAKTGMIPNNCKGKITRCAARSVCGKTGFVTCHIPVLGTCDTSTGTCVEDTTLMCTSDADCVLGTKCKIKASSDLCMAKGGTVGTSPTCCASCIVPTP